ncbi:unknown [Prevotella sp. CAG:1185]|nr:unknown [Prevotella sp. CAG:1185]
MHVIVFSQVLIFYYKPQTYNMLIKKLITDKNKR